MVPTDCSVEHSILIRVLLTRKWSPRTIRSSTSFSSEFSLRANGPHGLFGRALHSHPSSPYAQVVPTDYSVEHFILIRVLHSPYAQVVPTDYSVKHFILIRVLHAQVVPTDYSVEHFILIRVLLTRKWSPRTIRSSTSFSSEFSILLTRKWSPRTIWSSTSFSSEFSLRASGPHGLFGQALHSGEPNWRWSWRLRHGGNGSSVTLV
jgi:hypothetical protein